MLEIIKETPDGDIRPVPLLFIHGAWHGAWCWQPHFLPYFAQQGFQSYAMSFRNHGKSNSRGSINLVGAWDYVEDVKQAVAQINNETGAMPVLIGHSMGGYVVQKYLEVQPAPAAVLLASVPVGGSFRLVRRMLWYLLRKHPLRLLQMLLLLDQKQVVATVEQVAYWFFHPDTPIEHIAQYQSFLQSESMRILFDTAFFQRPRPELVRPTPMLVVAAEQDRVFSVAEQHQTALAYKVSPVVVPNIGHDVMLELNWEAAAERIAKWLGEQGF